MEHKFSYTSADALPIKLLKDESVIRSINKSKIIPPVHIQFSPTNKCNLNCEFCSCENEDRNLQMSLNDVIKIIDICKSLGTKAVTVTGGGSPCLHPNINEIITHFLDSGIEVGLVDNGLALDKIDRKILNRITWCRISHADFRPFETKYKERLEEVIKSAPDVDWAFSYVVSKNFDLFNISKIIEFANNNKFTHVRLVADLFNPAEIDMLQIKESLRLMGVCDDIVIYQNRSDPQKGGYCFIGFLKPVISADCNVYACCGVQYYKNDAPKKFPKELCLGSAFDLKDIISKSFIPVNGHICEICYYKEYNNILNAMIKETQHSNFI